MCRQLADRFVKDPHEVVKAGDVVKVRVRRGRCRAQAHRADDAHVGAGRPYRQGGRKARHGAARPGGGSLGAARARQRADDRRLGREAGGGVEAQLGRPAPARGQKAADAAPQRDAQFLLPRQSSFSVLRNFGSDATYLWRGECEKKL